MDSEIGFTFRISKNPIPERMPRMKILGTSLLCMLAASFLAGCCCGSGCSECDHSPVGHSSGNPYECGSGNFWGVGHYCQQYGFLCRPDTWSCDAVYAVTPCHTYSEPEPAYTEAGPPAP